MSVAWFAAGLFVEFILNRILDSISHKNAMKINYDCTRCNYKCNGYHCFKMRQEIADDLKQGGTNELPDVQGENSNRDADKA